MVQSVSANLRPFLSVVAMRGLGGDAIIITARTQRCSNFHPQQVLDARIMTFSYNADVAFGQSMAEILIMVIAAHGESSEATKSKLRKNHPDTLASERSLSLG